MPCKMSGRSLCWRSWRNGCQIWVWDRNLLACYHVCSSLYPKNRIHHFFIMFMYHKTCIVCLYIPCTVFTVCVFICLLYLVYLHHFKDDDLSSESRLGTAALQQVGELTQVNA